MVNSIGEGFTWFGRLAVSIIVVYVISNGLMLNSRFNKDPIAPVLGGLFAGLVCMIMLYVIGKKQ